MSESSGPLSGPEQLENVRTRVRELVRGRHWLRDAFRSAFHEFWALSDRYGAERRDLDAKEKSLAVALLKRGFLSDPDEQRERLMVRIDGRCPVSLAKRLVGTDPDTLSPSLRRSGAGAALAALEWNILYQSRDVPEARKEAMREAAKAEIAKGTHVEFTWRVFPARPADWQEPANPHSLDREDLERFTELEFRAIALYRLGGLADAGSSRPLIARPKDTGDGLRDHAAYLLWRSRFPVRDEDFGLDHPPLDPANFPPRVAEEMLDVVEEWVHVSENEAGVSPSAALSHALSGARGTLANRHLFRDLAARRNEERLRRISMANTLTRGEFATFTEAEAVAELAETLLKTVEPREPRDYLFGLSDILDEIGRWCHQANVALERGGAKAVDDALAPGSASHAVAWNVDLQRLESALLETRLWLWNPRINPSGFIDVLDRAAEWVERAAMQMSAVALRAQAGGPDQKHDAQVQEPKNQAPAARARPGAQSRGARAIGGLCTVADLAAAYNVPQEALRKRLDRWRKKNAISGDWVQDADATSRKPQFLYRVEAVSDIAEALATSVKASGERPAKRNSTKKHS